jgi:hypothetical protein
MATDGWSRRAGIPRILRNTGAMAALVVAMPIVILRV